MSTYKTRACDDFCAYHGVILRYMERLAWLVSRVFVGLCYSVVLCGGWSKWSAKPLFIGSIPIAASNKSLYYSYLRALFSGLIPAFMVTVTIIVLFQGRKPFNLFKCSRCSRCAEAFTFTV